MGKLKSRRAKIRQPCPTGVPSLKELEKFDELESQFDVTTVDSIIEKLNQVAPGSKECAAFTIANLADNTEFSSAFIKQQVVRIAAPHMLHENLSVRHAIVGCLRNLSSCGGQEVSQSMVDQDVMTPLISLMQQYKEPWALATSLGKIDSKAEIFKEACNLLWSLCECSNTAMTIFNDSKIVKILLPCLNIETFHLEIPLAVAQCLHSVAEDNSEVTDVLSQPIILEQIKTLMSLKPVEPEHVLLKTLAAGIVLEVYSGKLDNCLSEITTSILEAVSCALSIPILPDFEKVSEQIASHKSERLNKYREDGVLEEKFAAMNETFKALDHVLPAKQIALEILTNICFGDDSNDDWDNLSSSDTSEEICMDIDDSSSPPLKLVLRVPREVCSIIVQDKMLSKVVQQIVTPPQEISDIMKESSKGKKCLERLSSSRCRALFCLSNMVQNLEIDDLGGPSVLFDLWLNLGNLVFKETDISNTEQLEAATSSMRAVLQKLVETDCSSQFNKMTEPDLELLADICHKSPDPATKVNIIRSIGTIGCLLGNPHQVPPSRLINVIGTFLVEICGKSSDMWVVAEALDVIFDVFAEDHLDPIACEINLVGKLTHLIPLLKGKIKQQRKSLGEHLPVIMTAKTNLARFIKYKNEMRNK